MLHNSFQLLFRRLLTNPIPYAISSINQSKFLGLKRLSMKYFTNKLVSTEIFVSTKKLSLFNDCIGSFSGHQYYHNQYQTVPVSASKSTELSDFFLFFQICDFSSENTFFQSSHHTSTTLI